MNKKTIGAGLLALALPALLLSANTVGANAATVTSSVTAIDSCEWQLAGAPTSVSLTSSGSAKYRGELLEVTGTADAMILGVAGKTNTASATNGTSSECSFYNSVVAGGVTVSIADLQFDASFTNGATTATDTGMDFVVSSTNALTVAITSTPSCSAAFTLTSANLQSTVLSTLIATSTSGVNAIANVNNAGANVRCDSDLAFSIDIPSKTGVPAGAGYQYSFAGPIMTFSKVG